MSAFKEMTTLKNSEHTEKNRETERPVMRESDVPRLPSNVEISDTPLSDFSDIYSAAFKSLGLSTDSAESKTSESNESNENKDYSDYLEKGEDGKYYDKETRKSYDSIEAWEKDQETLAKRYGSIAKYYEDKAKKEWARFKNAEKNGESDTEKWEHYRRSQEYYAKAKECKEKAEHIWAKLEKTNEVRDSDNSSDAQESKDKQDASERYQYSGEELLLIAMTSPFTLMDRANNKGDAAQIKKLCEDILERAYDDEEIEPQDRLLPEYQRLMDENGYENEEEMCNAEGLNWDEIYDDEPSTYGEEYKNGFVDCIDKNKSPYTNSEDECNEAYYQGLLDAQELRDLLG